MDSLIDADTALTKILALLPELVTERLSPHEAFGRALAENVLARRTLPPWGNSAMDGYAVRAEDTRYPGARLKVVGEILAGGPTCAPLAAGECARIMTGGPLPVGADSVVMQERARAENAKGSMSPVLQVSQAVQVLIDEAVIKGQFVRPAGEDSREGEPLLPKGTSIGVAEASLLWSQGTPGQGPMSVSVPRRPRVAILATGDELCTAGEPVEGKLIDVNTPALIEAVLRAGGEPHPQGIIRDDPAAIDQALQRRNDFDVVISCGGASVGNKDFLKETLTQMGVEWAFRSVSIKPGKPLAAGKRGRTVYFTLPGNPVSAWVTFELFVRPALRRMLGHAQVLTVPLPARLEGGYRKPSGIRHFLRVVAEPKDGHLWARPLTSQNSGAMRSAVAASHLCVIPETTTLLKAGMTVSLLPLSWPG